jgi:N-acetylneuraminate synthase
MQDLAQLVQGIRKIEKALGEKKRIHQREKQIRKWALRSVVTTTDIPTGAILTPDMLWTKRPGTGIPSRELPYIIGRKTKRFLKENTLLRRQDID